MNTPPNQIKDSDTSKKINPVVFRLGLVSFFADVASEMLYPITPIFLTTILGASMTSLGLIEGFAEALASLLKTFSGSWSDKIQKRKPFILVGYTLGAVAKPLIGFSSSWVHVLMARSLDRFGKGLRTAPRDALIADSVPESSLGSAFGWHRAMDTLGASLGPLIAIFLLSFEFNNLRNIYLWAIIPGLLSILVLTTLKENKISNPQHKIWVSPFSMWEKTSIEFKKYLFTWGLFSIANSSDVFLLMKAKSSGFTLNEVIYFYVGYNLIYALSSPYLGKLSDSWDRKKILSLGLLIFSLAYFGFSVASKPWHFILLFSIYGLYMGATDGVGKALAVDLCDKNNKASYLGLLGTVTGVATIIASFTAGLLWDHLGAKWTFYYGAIGALLAMLCLLFIKEEDKKSMPSSF